MVLLLVAAYLTFGLLLVGCEEAFGSNTLDGWEPVLVWLFWPPLLVGFLGRAIWMWRKGE